MAVVLRRHIGVGRMSSKGQTNKEVVTLSPRTRGGEAVLSVISQNPAQVRDGLRTRCSRKAKLAHKDYISVLVVDEEKDEVLEEIAHNTKVEILDFVS